MHQSRSNRVARGKQKRARHYQKYAVLAAVLVVLGMGIYYIWSYEPASIAGERSAKDSELNHAAEDVERQPEPEPVQEPESEQEKEPEPEPEPLPIAEEPADTVSLALVGDIMMGGRIDDLLKKQGFDYPYRHVNTYLSEVDIAAGNLENPITDRGEAYEKTFTFRTSPEAVPAMKESGFDVFNLANNHTLDFGLVGLRDTIKYLDEAELGHMGAGENEAEAFQPYTINKNGMRVDFIGLTNVVPDTSWKAGKNHPGLAETYNYTKAVEAIQASEAEAELTVVMVHWGKERKDTPEKYMVENAHRYIDAGADLVIGSHPHVLQGFELYKNKWIAYSLGNFIFTVSPSAATKESAILRADCHRDGICELKVIPMETGVGQPLPPSEENGAAILDKLNKLSVGAEVMPDGKVIPSTLVQESTHQGETR